MIHDNCYWSGMIGYLVVGDGRWVGGCHVASILAWQDTGCAAGEKSWSTLVI